MTGRALPHLFGSFVLVALAAAGLETASPFRPTGAAASAAVSADAPLVRAVETLGFTVSDADRAIDFYTRVLDFEKVSDVEVANEPLERLQGVFGARLRVVRLRLGSETIELTEYVAAKGRPYPEASRSHDRWFQHAAIVVRDMDAAYARLRAHRVEHVSTGPQRLPDWNPNAGGISAFYFRDPDGHVLELIHFPAGKGLPKWQEPTERLFLGIDHTAIGVADTEASLRFYRDELGLAVAGASENWGTEQEHLNLVFGARLRITALRAATGPGIELLQYLSPDDGRPYPTDLRPNDVAHWQVTVSGAPASEAARALVESRRTLVSPRDVALPEDTLGFTRGVLARDPDRHAIRFVER